jgi:hypothetical protein
MISLNPYVYLGGAAAAALLILSFLGMSHQIHSWHVKYDTDEKTIAILQDRMTQMDVEAKKRQTDTATVVTRVVTQSEPPVIKIIKEAPIPADCTTPAIDALRTNT